MQLHQEMFSAASIHFTDEPDKFQVNVPIRKTDSFAVESLYLPSNRKCPISENDLVLISGHYWKVRFLGLEQVSRNMGYNEKYSW